MGTFRDDSAGFTVTGPCSCGGSLYTRGAALIPRQISSARASEEVKPGMAWHGGTHGVFRFCEGNARSLHEPFDFHWHLFRSPVVQPAAREELLDYSQSFPRSQDGRFCRNRVYLQANSFALQEHNNPPQTWPGTTQYPQQAPAH